MSLAGLLYPSPTKQGWAEWAFHNYQHHLAIDASIKKIKGIEVVPFRIWPINQVEFQTWLQEHQEYHNTYSQILGTPGQDLSEFDTKNKAKRDDWFFVHEQEHRAAATILGDPLL